MPTKSELLIELFKETERGKSKLKAWGFPIVVDLFKDAVRSGNLKDIGQRADALRIMGVSYRETFEFAKEAKPDLEVADWDALLL